MGTVIFTIFLIVCLSMRPVASVNGYPIIQWNEHDPIQPCENFYRFVCTQWVKEGVPRGATKWTELEKIARTAKYRISEYLEKPVKKEDIRPVQWAKIHFQACMNDNATNENGMRSLAYIVNSVVHFGWNILGESPENNWVAVHNSYWRLTGKGALFTVEVERNQISKQKMIIISPTEELFLRDISKSNPDDIQQYAQFLTEIWTAYAKAQSYPAYSPDAVKDAIQDIMSFRQAIIEKRKLIETTSNLEVTTLSILEEHTRPNMNRKDLNWSQFLESMFHVKFKETTVVHIRQFNYVKIILRAIGSTPVKVLLNHIHFHFLERFIQHTSTAMNTLFYRVLKLPVPERWITCISSNVMKRIVNYIYVQEHIMNNDISLATKVTQKVRDIMKRQISGTTWMDEKAARIAMLKLVKINLVIGYNSWYAKEKNVIDYYSRMTISNNYMRNILDFEITSYRYKMATSVTEKRLIDPFALSASYNYKTNTLVVPAVLFDFPIVKKPRALTFFYGGLGTIVGHALSRSLDSLGRQYDEKGNRGYWWNSDTQSAFNRRSQCYSQKLKGTALTAEQDFTQVKTNYYSDDIVAEYIGLVAAFESYKNKFRTIDVSEKSTYKIFNGSEFQEFFVIYAMRRCEAFAAPIWAQMTADGHLSQEWRVNAALSNMQGFADTFRCKEKDPMNYPQKCQFLNETSIRNME